MKKEKLIFNTPKTILDKSGNGNHFVEPNLKLPPLYLSIELDRDNAERIENWIEGCLDKMFQIESERDKLKRKSKAQARLINLLDKELQSLKEDELLFNKSQLQILRDNIVELNKTMPNVSITKAMMDWCDKLEELAETVSKN